MRLSGLRDYKLYIADIEEAVIKILTYTKDHDFASFIEDPKTYESVLHNLFIIGEAAKKFQKKYRFNILLLIGAELSV